MPLIRSREVGRENFFINPQEGDETEAKPAKKVKKQRNLKILSEFIPSGKAKEEKDIQEILRGS